MNTKPGKPVPPKRATSCDKQGFILRTFNRKLIEYLIDCNENNTKSSTYQKHE